MLLPTETIAPQPAPVSPAPATKTGQVGATTSSAIPAAISSAAAALTTRRPTSPEVSPDDSAPVAKRRAMTR